MSDSVSGVTSAMRSGTIKLARLKVGTSETQDVPKPGLTTSERQMTDIVDVGAAAMARAEKGRKLDAFLRLYTSVLKFINGGHVTGTSPAQASAIINKPKIDIEYVTVENPYARKTDKTV